MIALPRLRFISQLLRLQHKSIYKPPFQLESFKIMPHLKDLKAAKSLQDTAQLLGFKPEALGYILYKQASTSKYNKFEIRKRTGGLRTISAPDPKLKLLQTRLSILLQNCIDQINHARNIDSAISHGFRRKYSIITNAAVHRNRRYVFNIDLENFFGTINFGRVRGFFLTNRNFLLNPTVATILAQIACHDNCLPQGSPCSPVISNLIGHILDIKLAAIAHKTGCTYSRYADDLTFSTNTPNFPSKVATIIESEKQNHHWEVGKELEKIIRKSGFEINSSKTRMQYDGSRQEVTGLIVNKKINTRSEYRRTARAMVHRLLKTGKFQRKLVSVDEHGNTIVSEVDGTLGQLNGILSFIDSVSVYNRKKVMTIAEKKKIHKPLDNPDAAEISYQRFLFFKNFYSPSKPVIICEGKTDNIYIRAAIHQLVGDYPRLAEQEKKDKINLNVKLFQYTHTTKRLLKLGGGTDNLRQFMNDFPNNCEKIEASGLQHPVIILIDNDDGANKIYSFLKKATNAKADIKGCEPYYFIAPNLYVVATPKDANGADTMIEDFFDQSVRNEKNRGKTFNPKEPVNVKTEYGKFIFAEQIVKKNQNRIDFSGFKPILDRIDAVLIDFQERLSVN